MTWVCASCSWVNHLKDPNKSKGHCRHCNQKRGAAPINVAYEKQRSRQEAKPLAASDYQYRNTYDRNKVRTWGNGIPWG